MGILPSIRVPAPLRRLYDAWMAFSHALGRVMSAIILTVLWVIGFGAYAIVLKLLPKKPAAAGWTPVQPTDGESFRRQF